MAQLHVKETSWSLKCKLDILKVGTNFIEDLRFWRVFVSCWKNFGFWQKSIQWFWVENGPHKYKEKLVINLLWWTTWEMILIKVSCSGYHKKSLEFQTCGPIKTHHNHVRWLGIWLGWGSRAMILNFPHAMTF